MPDDDTLGFQEAAAIVAELARACAERTGALPKTIVLVGGAALAAHAVRHRSRDVDVFLNYLNDDAVAATTAKYSRRYGPNFKIDATSCEALWGAINIRDISTSPIVARVKSCRENVVIRALSIETLYLVKANADREKDRVDLVNLAKHTCYSDLLERARTIFPWYSDRRALPNFVERLARRVAEHFSVPLALVDQDFAWPNAVSVKVCEIRRHREEHDWPALIELMLADTQHLVFDPTLLERTMSDAKAAGAPDTVQQALRDRSKRAADLAAELLSAAGQRAICANHEFPDCIEREDGLR